MLAAFVTRVMCLFSTLSNPRTFTWWKNKWLNILGVYKYELFYLYLALWTMCLSLKIHPLCLAFIIVPILISVIHERYFMSLEFEKYNSIFDNQRQLENNFCIEYMYFEWTFGKRSVDIIIWSLLTTSWASNICYGNIKRNKNRLKQSDLLLQFPDTNSKTRANYSEYS